MGEKPIEWSKKFTEDAEKVVALTYSWSKKTALGFIDTLYHKIAYIKYSLSGIPYKKHKGVFRIFVTKHNSLFYKVYDSRIGLLSIFDTRPNLSKSPF